jgi:hypothetical protein
MPRRERNVALDHQGNTTSLYFIGFVHAGQHRAARCPKLREKTNNLR